MCGIAGMFSSLASDLHALNQEEILSTMSKRGPDDAGVFEKDTISLFHRRLSIIDTSTGGHQPMSDDSKRYTIVYNGEFFNYRQEKKRLIQQGISFTSDSDTEVILQLYKQEGTKCLSRINGFFAIGIYDALEQTLLLARDRFGVKPLLIQSDTTCVRFASEMKTMVSLGITKELDLVSIQQYFALNYIPQPYTPFKSVRKLNPGSWEKYSCKDGNIHLHTKGRYYTLESPSDYVNAPSYDDAGKQLYHLLDKAVERRLVSDVPLGSFLSGGIDSSIVSALAAQKIKGLKTFSIGYTHDPHFDETYYAELVAAKIKSDHQVFSLSMDDLLHQLDAVLDYMDEPFADSSAIPVFMLSQKVKQQVTVALSGDGADEIFAGYNKHRAEWLVRNNPWMTKTIPVLSNMLLPFKGSRNSPIGNRLRQLNRFAAGIRLSADERYWQWASISSSKELHALLACQINQSEYEIRKSSATQVLLDKTNDFNSVLLTDMKLVLTSDMLFKVDMMSMANGLEIRSPFMDYTLIDFAFALPHNYKINKQHQKRILKDSFRHLLPEELYNRPKKGFEVPLLHWFRKQLNNRIQNDWLNEEKLISQNLFNADVCKIWIEQLHHAHPGDVAARLWAMIVFQHWYSKHFSA